MKMMMMLMVMMATSFAFTNHPLSFGMLIIMKTLMVAMMIGLMMGSFWFSYILMITMVSGMLVLFIYMASVASNEKFKLSIKTMLMSMVAPIIFMNNNLDMFNMMKEYDISMIMNKLFNSLSMMITIIMVMYLLFTMITVSKIVNINEGPLRIKK